MNRIDYFKDRKTKIGYFTYKDQGVTSDGYRSFYIDSLFIKASHRKQGYLKNMLEDATKHLVNISNEPVSITLYSDNKRVISAMKHFPVLEHVGYVYTDVIKNNKRSMLRVFSNNKYNNQYEFSNYFTGDKFYADTIEEVQEEIKLWSLTYE